MESHPSAATPSFTVFTVTLRVYKTILEIKRGFPCGLIGKNANSDNSIDKIRTLLSIKAYQYPQVFPQL
jgi:hypothetical protein